MITCSTAFDSTRIALPDTRDMLISEVRRGLRACPRSLAPWMFYDARGSRLFEQITQLPEYYPTRTERAILTNHCDDVIAAAFPDRRQPVRLVELGAGTGSKTVILLQAAARLQTEVQYLPVDVSVEALAVARDTIATTSPIIYVAPIVANYVSHPPQLPSFDGATLALYIGSSIGNFTPAEARTILRNIGSQLQPGDALLLGVDMVKDEPTLLTAYDDRHGVTAEFNLNMLHRLNNELAANFIPSRFRHRALWNHEHSRIEMHLESACDQQVHIPAADLDVHLARGERIHTENSYKFTEDTIRQLLADAGFDIERAWQDTLGWYSVTLARVR